MTASSKQPQEKHSDKLPSEVGAIFFGTDFSSNAMQAATDPALGYERFKCMLEVMTRRLQSARTRLLKAYAAGSSGGAGVRA